MSNTNFLAEIQRKNVRALLDYHNMSIQELAKLSGYNRSALSHTFGDVRKPADPSEEKLKLVADVFKIWHGLLSQRDFDPRKTNKPYESMTITLQLDNLTETQANNLEKLFIQLKELVV